MKTTSAILIFAFIFLYFQIQVPVVNGSALRSIEEDNDESGFWSAVRKVGKHVVEQAKNVGSKVGNAIKDVGSRVGDAIQDVGSKVGNRIKYSRFGDTIINVGSKVGETIKNVGSKVGNAVKDAGSKVSDTIKDIGGQAVIKMKKVEGIVSDAFKKGYNVVVGQPKKSKYINKEHNKSTIKFTKASLKGQQPGEFNNIPNTDISFEINNEQDINEEINNDLHLTEPRPSEDDPEFNLAIIDKINHMEDGYDKFKEDIETNHPEDEEYIHFSDVPVQCDQNFCGHYGDGFYGFGICTPYICGCQGDEATQYQCDDGLVYDHLFNDCDDLMTVKLCGMS